MQPINLYANPSIPVVALNMAITQVLSQDVNVSSGIQSRWRGDGGEPEATTWGGKELTGLRRDCLKILATEVCITKVSQIECLIKPIIYTEKVREREREGLAGRVARASFNQTLRPLLLRRRPQISRLSSS